MFPKCPQKSGCYYHIVKLKIVIRVDSIWWCYPTSNFSGGILDWIGGLDQWTGTVDLLKLFPKLTPKGNVSRYSILNWKLGAHFAIGAKMDLRCVYCTRNTQSCLHTVRRYVHVDADIEMVRGTHVSGVVRLCRVRTCILYIYTYIPST